jgi:hypothetical protein
MHIVTDSDFDLIEEVLEDRSLEKRASLYAQHLRANGLPNEIVKRYKDAYSEYELMTSAMKKYLISCFEIKVSTK